MLIICCCRILAALTRIIVSESQISAFTCGARPISFSNARSVRFDGDLTSIKSETAAVTLCRSRVEWEFTPRETRRGEYLPSCKLTVFRRASTVQYSQPILHNSVLSEISFEHPHYSRHPLFYQTRSIREV